MADIHGHDGKGGDPQRTARSEHGGNDKLAGSRIDNAGEKDAFNRRKAKASGIETKCKSDRNIADDYWQAVFESFR